MIRYIILTVAIFGSTGAQAQIKVETECYVRAPASKDNKPIRMIFRRYVDQDLKKEIGSFVQYNSAVEIIPLVFGRHIDTDLESAGLKNYEDSRIEIVGSKVGGLYTFVQTGAGNTQGKYVRYTSAKTGKSVIFQYTGDDDSSCKVNYR